jgi:hypothetical protein
VTVTFGPAGNGCGSPVFEPVSGYTGGIQQLPYIGDAGTQTFAIPQLLSSPSPSTNAPVNPGSYQFVVTCDTTNNPATVRTASAPFTVTAG